MFRNYIIITFRNLYKNRVFALINILGLGVALAICIVAYFNHMFQHDFDRWHEHFDEIYRVNTFRQMQDRDQEYGLVPLPLGPQLAEELPSVNNATRILRSYSPVKVGEDIFNRQIAYVDPAFLEMFTIYPEQGNTDVLLDQNSVLVSEELAEVLYGGADPLGKPVSIFNDENEEFTFTIGAVFRCRS